MRNQEEQMWFRRQVLHNFSNRCAVTGKHFRETCVEAAHIKFHKDGGQLVVPNGIPLIGNLHTLHDEFLMSIHPEYQTVHFIIDGLDYEGKRLLDHNIYLDKESLIWHWTRFLEIRKEYDIKTEKVYQACNF